MSGGRILRAGSVGTVMNRHRHPMIRGPLADRAAPATVGSTDEPPARDVATGTDQERRMA
jgi:hypothetical protein